MGSVSLAWALLTNLVPAHFDQVLWHSIEFAASESESDVARYLGYPHSPNSWAESYHFFWSIKVQKSPRNCFTRQVIDHQVVWPGADFLYLLDYSKFGPYLLRIYDGAYLVLAFVLSLCWYDSDPPHSACESATSTSRSILSPMYRHLETLSLTHTQLILKTESESQQSNANIQALKLQLQKSICIQLYMSTSMPGDSTRRNLLLLI